jgi:flagella synthesis protein FlgN
MQHAPIDNLGAEVAAGTALLQLLRQEQDQLVSANIDAIGALTEQKTRLLMQMGELAQVRERTLQAAGFDASEAGVQAWLKTAPAASAEAWKALTEIAREAKELNRVNGLLIGQHMARNQAALNVLHGGSPAGGGDLYGPNGQSTGLASSRRLVIG